MSTLRVIARNIASNWVGFAVQVAVTFLLTPLIVRTLGAGAYGVWVLVISLTGYYGLLDMGLRGALTQYIARYLATGDMQGVNRTASTGAAVLAGCGAVVGVASLVLAAVIGSVFDLPADQAAEARTAILVVGLATAVQFPLFPFTAVFPATQRFDIANLIFVCTRLVYAAGVYLALEGGHGLVGLSLVTAGINLADYFIRWRVAYRLLPGLRVRPRLARRDSLRELVGYGAWGVVVSGSVRLISYTDAVVIGVFLPTAAITPFALAASLVDYFVQLFVPMAIVFFPLVTEKDASGDRQGVREVYLQGSRLIATLALPLAVVAGGFAVDFFRLWIGAPAESADFPSAAALFHVLVIAAAVAACQRVSYQVLTGTRRMRLMAALFLSEAALNVAISVVLIQRIGLVGVAIGTLVPAVLIQFLVMPGIICRTYGISALESLGGVYLRPVLIALVMAPVVWAALDQYPPTDWLRFAVSGGACGALALCLVSAVGLSRAQRQRFIAQPLARLRARIAPGHR